MRLIWVLQISSASFCSDSYPWQRARMVCHWEVPWHLLERQTAAFPGSPKQEVDPYMTGGLWDGGFLWQKEDLTLQKNKCQKQPHEPLCMAPVTDRKVHFWLHVEILGQRFSVLGSSLSWTENKTMSSVLKPGYETFKNTQRRKIFIPAELNISNLYLLGQHNILISKNPSSKLSCWSFDGVLKDIINHCNDSWRK